MRALTMLTFFLVPACAHAQTGSDADILAQAESAFQQGIAHKNHFLQARPHFAKAANDYLDLHKRGVRSPALYRNLGDAALLADRLPEAIWAYHMSLAFDSNDARAREHLAFARSKVL